MAAKEMPRLFKVVLIALSIYLLCAVPTVRAEQQTGSFLKSMETSALYMLSGEVTRRGGEIRQILVAPTESSFFGDGASVQIGGRPGDVEFIYDPTLLSGSRDALSTLHDLRVSARLMRTATYRDRLKDEIVVPISTENEEDLRPLKLFSRRDLQIFLGRKTSYLEKVATVLSSLRLPIEAVNRVITLLNDQFYKHADVVRHANSNATAVSLNIGVGAGLPEWLLGQLRKVPLLARVPEKVGFFIGFSVGIAIVHTVGDGRVSLRIEPFADFRRSEKIYGALLSASASISVSTELLIPRGGPGDGSHSRFISFSGTALTSSSNSLGISRTVLGISLPPFGGRFTVIQGKNHSFRVDGTGLANLKQYVGDYFQNEMPTVRRWACKTLLAGS